MIVLFSNFAVVVWTENIWCFFQIFSGVLWASSQQRIFGVIWRQCKRSFQTKSLYRSVTSRQMCERILAHLWTCLYAGTSRTVEQHQEDCSDSETTSGSSPSLWSRHHQTKMWTVRCKFKSLLPLLVLQQSAFSHLFCLLIFFVHRSNSTNLERTSVRQLHSNSIPWIITIA